MGLFSKKPKLSTESLKNGVALVTDYDPTAIISEEFRTLRTNILYSNADKQIKTLVFTSAGPSEGKSTVSGNTAVTFANQGIKTLLVDADMRRPTIHATFHIQNKDGLVDLLTGVEDENKIEKAVRSTSIDNLNVLPSGPVPPNPSELLSSKRMQRLTEQLKTHFDLVIFDLPPLISVTDAQVMASHCDGTVLVVPYGIARKNMVADAVDLLKKVDANLLGAVMNRVPKQERSNYYGYYYNSYTAEEGK